MNRRGFLLGALTLPAAAGAAVTLAAQDVFAPPKHIGGPGMLGNLIEIVEWEVSPGDSKIEHNVWLGPRESGPDLATVFPMGTNEGIVLVTKWDRHFVYLHSTSPRRERVRVVVQYFHSRIR